MVRRGWMAAMLCLAACSGDGLGGLSIRVAWPFRVADMPPQTESITLLVEASGQVVANGSVSRVQPKMLFSGLFPGMVTVTAVALDADCTPLATALATALVKPGEKGEARLTLEGLDRALAERVLRRFPCEPVVEPSPLPQAVESAPPEPEPTQEPVDPVVAEPSSEPSAAPDDSGGGAVAPQVDVQASVTDGSPYAGAPAGAP